MAKDKRLIKPQPIIFLSCQCGGVMDKCFLRQEGIEATFYMCPVCNRTKAEHYVERRKE